MYSQKNIIFHNDTLTPNEQAKVIRMTLSLFDHWQIDTSSKLILLGLSPRSRALLSQYQEKTKLHLSSDTLDRISWLLTIHQALRSLYSENVKLCYNWVNLTNEQLDKQTPLEFMKAQGLIGLAKVARYLQSQLVL